MRVLSTLALLAMAAASVSAGTVSLFNNTAGEDGSCVVSASNVLSNLTFTSGACTIATAPGESATSAFLVNCAGNSTAGVFYGFDTLAECSAGTANATAISFDSYATCTAFPGNPTAFAIDCPVTGAADSSSSSSGAFSSSSSSGGNGNSTSSGDGNGASTLAASALLVAALAVAARA